ncbi:hypothetical protein HZ994_03040 [Akkermansiaceae bacterium]|nr:hypothetical protein HZ994_03040 [Akkermansiaceae bacterium]
MQGKPEPPGEPRLWPVSSRTFAWGASIAIIAAACAAWSSLPSLGSCPILRVAIFAAMGIAMLGSVFLFPDGPDRIALILIPAILLRIILWPAPVSDDVNRYLWEGQLVAAGENPYAAPADDPRWESLHDSTWQAMNHRDRPTAYPPGVQWIMAATATIYPSLKSFKALALLGDMATLLLLFALLRDNTAPLRWAGFYAFNPVVLIAFAAEAHFDSLMAAALLAAILAASRNKKSAWLWLALAVQIKLVCLILAPLFLIPFLRFIRFHTRPFGEEHGNFQFAYLRFAPVVVRLLLFSAILILPSLPFLTALPQWLHGVGSFATAGDFNAPLFTLLASTGLALGMVKNICLATFGVSAAAILIGRWKGMPLIDSCLWMLGTLLACSPIVHFWYLAWLLPLTAIRPSFAWTTASITMAGYFIAWWTQENLGWWGYGHSIATVIWLPWFLAALAQHRHLPARVRSSLDCGSPAAALGDAACCEPHFAIVIPALENTPSLTDLLQTIREELPDSEVILPTPSPHFPQIPNTRHIPAPLGRGNQIAAAIATTTAPWILIVHADATPPPGSAKHLLEEARKHPQASLIVPGQRFDDHTPATLLIEALNELRVVFGGIAFGDQTMLIRRSAIEAAGGFPAQPLMEDVEASLRLATQGSILYLGREWKVSAKKWQGNFLKRFTLVIRLTATYQLARLRSPAHAAAVSESMYREYYPQELGG